LLDSLLADKDRHRMIVAQEIIGLLLACVLASWFTYPFRRAAKIDRVMEEWDSGYGKGPNPLDKGVL
jgi:hypothetical protein